MIPNNYKTSLRVPSQLPEFIRDDVNYETFVAFVEAYYEWMELANTANANTTIATTSGQGVTYGSKNLQNYSDIDSTLDGFLQYYINDFLPYFPQDALADKDKVLKIAKQLYQSKGTPASYKLLFRLLYNSDAQLLMTGDLVFRASAGEWYVPKFLKINGDAALWLTPGIKNYRVFGQTSKSFATIENVILNGSKCDVYISNIERLFQSGEDVIVVDVNNQDIYVKDNEVVSKGTTGSSTITGKIVGAISQINIDPRFRGLTYNVGDPVVVYGGLTSNTANGATAFVSEVTRGSIQRINTLDGGFGYIPGSAVIDFVTIANTTINFIPNNGGASASVATFDNSPGANSSINGVILDRISIRQLTRLDALQYNFTANATANLNCTLEDAFTFYSTQGFPIASVAVNNGGGGFSQLPVAIATSHYFDVETGGIHDLDKFGILAPIEILDGGVGYKANDRITIVGGSGRGASANVTAVDGNGTITEVRYVTYENSSESYPIGGLGYRVTDINGNGISSQLSANPSSNIAVTTITQGKFPLWDTVYQTFDTYANSFFTATVNGIDTANNSLKVYGIEGTLNNTRPLISLANTQNTATATSNSIAGVGADLYVPGILGAGAQFQLTTDRIGSVTKIAISNPGEDYISNPLVSLRVQDLCVTGITQFADIIPGSLVYQGQSIIGAPYQAYVDRLTLIEDNGGIQSNIYNLRVYNYYGTPALLNLSNTSNTIIKLDNSQVLYPTMNLTNVKDSTLGYSNGVKKYGDGTAKAKSKFLNGLIFGNGQYLNTKGQPSSFSILQSENYNDFTYVLSVEQPIARYRQILKNLLHPAGTKVIGRNLLKNQKAFKVLHDSGSSQIKPLQYWANWPVGNPDAFVTMKIPGILANSMVKVISGGTGYSPSTTVTITSNDGKGTGATAVANIANGVITSIDITNEGQDYILSPTITVSDPTTRGGNSNVVLSVVVSQSANVITIENMNGGDLSSITSSEKFIFVYPEQTGGNCVIYSDSKSYDNANGTIVLEDDTFLTFLNVFYGYANTDVNKIQISDFNITNTPSYNIVNGGTYSNTQNHIEDIVFVGDNIVIAGNTYVVQAVDYDSHLITILNVQGLLSTQANDNILTEDGANNILLGNYVINAGTKANPVPMTINRTISTGNVFIKTLI